MKPSNNFGILRDEYNTARRGYPVEVYTYLHTLAEIGTPHTLDLGCGTGISTRELIESGFDMIGADKDASMLEIAQKHSPNIRFVVATADQLPFSDNEFDIITAFTAFHWFNNQESLTEMHRALKPGGVFFAALKSNQQSEETRAFRRGYTDILKKYAGENFDSTKEHFKTEIFKKIFGDVKEKSFYVDEHYTVEEALALIRSLSLWNLVSEENKPRFIAEMKEFYEQNLIDGFVVRAREISTLAGVKI